jgi:enamine deaminase RidA (YjgF/YER057c/UK114 family)
MTSSPVFSRVAKINSDQMIYTSGMYSRMQSDAAGEVTDIFEQLGQVLKETGSDWKHLAKATYYCSNNDTSGKLNELRPKYYDPARPPAASKALVNGVGRAARGLTIDMIAVPTE